MKVACLSGVSAAVVLASKLLVKTKGIDSEHTSALNN